MYALLHSDEDGNPVHLLTYEELQVLLASPTEHGVKSFMSGDWLHDNPDANYWPNDVGVLLQFTVVVPKPVTTAWEL